MYERWISLCALDVAIRSTDTKFEASGREGTCKSHTMLNAQCSLTVRSMPSCMLMYVPDSCLFILANAKRSNTSLMPHLQHA